MYASFVRSFSKHLLSIHGNGLISERPATGANSACQFVNVKGNAPKGNADILFLGGNDGILCPRSHLKFLTEDLLDIGQADAAGIKINRVTSAPPPALFQWLAGTAG